MFTLAISCLTTYNFPWFMDLIVQVPMQYCSLQYQILLPSPVTSITGHCFHFGSISSFFLELFLHSSPAAYWVPTDLGSSSFSVISFCLFIQFLTFSRQEYWSGLPFPSPVDHVLSGLWFSVSLLFSTICLLAVFFFFYVISIFIYFAFFFFSQWVALWVNFFFYQKQIPLCLSIFL